MPVSRHVQDSIYDSAGVIPSGSTYSGVQRALDYDHAMVDIALTLGSLTSVDISPEFSLDKATWWPVEDCNGTVISWSFTADDDGVSYMGQDHNNARMQPLLIAAPYWRLEVVPTGTNAGSSLVLGARRFSAGEVVG